MELLSVRSNLLSQEADFIVNASNTTLKLGSGVSMVLKRACGVELQIEMDRIREQVYSEGSEIQQGDVLATSSFALDNSLYILHAAVMNYNVGVKQLGARPSLDTIELILNNCIPYIEFFLENYKKAPTVAFPYLGCGVGGLEKQHVKKVFEDYVAKNIDINARLILVEFG